MRRSFPFSRTFRLGWTIDAQLSGYFFRLCRATRLSLAPSVTSPNLFPPNFPLSHPKPAERERELRERFCPFPTPAAVWYGRTVNSQRREREREKAKEGRTKSNPGFFGFKTLNCKRNSQTVFLLDIRLRYITDTTHRKRIQKREEVRESTLVFSRYFFIPTASQRAITWKAQVFRSFSPISPSARVPFCPLLAQLFAGSFILFSLKSFF